LSFQYFISSGTVLPGLFSNCVAIRYM
jgi:hypothetical protein